MKELNYKKEIKILEGEGFFGGSVAQGIRMPITAKSEYFQDFREKCQGNAFNGLFISNFGRVLITNGEYNITAKDGILTLKASKEVLYFETEERTLKSAHKKAMSLAFEEDEVDIPKDLLLYPQFCTWTEMLTHVTEEKILNYARSINESGLPHCLLIIDDGWMKDYGDWDFNPEKFSNPKAMMDELHNLGFKVELWLVPFVNKNVPDFELLAKNDALVRGVDGKPALRNWWNGDSYVLDMTNPFAKKWIKDKLDFYITEYGVDGFKFDAGDTDYYRFDDVTYAPTTPCGQSYLWSQFAKEYEYSELRTCFNLCGSHIITRLSDKQRNWSYECGIGALVPNMIQTGICGYPFSCADMIGGGVSADFEKEGCEDFEFELISRFCECATLMPSMQFSYAYWNRNEKVKQLFLKLTALHMSIKDYLSELIDKAKTDFEPILRHIEYEFPHQGYVEDNSIFMLGSKYLVAPVVNQGRTTQTVRLPKGCNWQNCNDGTIYKGGETVTVPAPVGTLPYFKKI